MVLLCCNCGKLTTGFEKCNYCGSDDLVLDLFYTPDTYVKSEEDAHLDFWQPVMKNSSEQQTLTWYSYLTMNIKKCKVLVLIEK